MTKLKYYSINFIERISENGLLYESAYSTVHKLFSQFLTLVSSDRLVSALFKLVEME